MAKAERNALIGGLLAVGAVVTGIWWLFFRDGDPELGPEEIEEEIEVEEVEEVEEIDPITAEPVKPVQPIQARPVIDLTTTGVEYDGVCGIDNVTKVDRARDADWAKRALSLLGFPVGTLLSSADKAQIKKFQAIARSMGLGAMANAPASFVDGKMGLCTLDALVEAAILYNAGQWSTP